MHTFVVRRWCICVYLCLVGVMKLSSAWFVCSLLKFNFTIFVDKVMLSRTCIPRNSNHSSRQRSPDLCVEIDTTIQVVEKERGIITVFHLGNLKKLQSSRENHLTTWLLFNTITKTYAHTEMAIACSVSMLNFEYWKDGSVIHIVNLRKSSKYPLLIKQRR